MKCINQIHKLNNNEMIMDKGHNTKFQINQTITGIFYSIRF